MMILIGALVGSVWWVGCEMFLEVLVPIARTRKGKLACVGLSVVWPATLVAMVLVSVGGSD